MAGKRTRPPAEVPGNQHAAKRAARPPTASPPTGHSSTPKLGAGPNSTPGTHPAVSPQNNRAERAERRSQVRDLREQLGQAADERNKLEQQVKTLNETQSKLLDSHTQLGQLRAQLIRTEMERKTLQLRVKAFEKATPQSPCPLSPLQQLQQLQERLRQVERDRQELEPQIKRLENSVAKRFFRQHVKVREFRSQMHEAEENGRQLAEQLEALEEDASNSPDRQSPDGQSRVQPLHDRLRQRGEQVEKLAQRLAALGESVVQHVAQTFMALTDALSEQPALMTSDNMSQHRRKMSRVAFRPVRSTDAGNPDAGVGDCWREMGDLVGYLAAYNFPQSVPWDNLPPTVQARLTQFAPKAYRYVEDDILARIVFGAWVWRILDEQVFSRDKGPWTGEHWEAYSQLQLLVAPLATPVPSTTTVDDEWAVRYHIWRNLTVGMIKHVTGDERRFPTDPVIQALKSELGPLFLMREGVSQSDRDDLDKRLALLAKYATMADYLMHLDRTESAVIWDHPDSGATSGFPFEAGRRPDGFKMVANSEAHPGASEERLNGQLVDFVVVPCLRRRGMEGGYGYGVLRDFQQPMQVVVDQFPDEKEGGCTGGDDVGAGRGEATLGGDEASSRGDDAGGGNAGGDGAGSGRAETS